MATGEENSNEFQRAVVAFDLSYMDDILLRYAINFCKISGLRTIYFAYVSESSDISKRALDEFQELAEQSHEHIVEKIRASIEKEIGLFDLQCEIIVKHGDTVEQLLRIVKSKKADLVLMGRKKEINGSGHVPGHMTRKSPASILLVPETFHSLIRNICIPTDFSDYTVLATRYARKLKDHSRAQIQYVNVFEVPDGYYKTGKTHDEFAKIMRMYSEMDFQHFAKSNDLMEFECTFLLSIREKKAVLIYQNALALKTDIIMLGSRGRSKTASLLIGSLAEKLVKINDSIPMLIVKKKDENMTFIEALLEI